MLGLGEQFVNRPYVPAPQVFATHYYELALAASGHGLRTFMASTPSLRRDVAAASGLPATLQPSILARVKVTFDIDQDLYRAIKVEAARADRRVRDVVEEALEAWLASAEELEDRESAEAALAEYEGEGGESAEAWFGRIAAETKSGYGSRTG